MRPVILSSRESTVQLCSTTLVTVQSLETVRLAPDLGRTAQVDRLTTLRHGCSEYISSQSFLARELTYLSTQLDMKLTILSLFLSGVLAANSSSTLMSSDMSNSKFDISQRRLFRSRRSTMACSCTFLWRSWTFSGLSSFSTRSRTPTLSTSL
jgi:hypothetical protein